MVKKNIGEIEVVLGIDAKKSDKALKKTTKELEKYGKKATKTNAAVKKSFDKSESRIKKFSANATKLFGAVAAAYATISVVKGLTDTITKFEKLEASLRTVTGSSEAAAKEFEKLQSFAATTPFQLTEVTAAFIKMKALGLDPSEAALSSYGNTATAMGKSLNQMIEAVADAATGEFERLKEFGIKARQQGENVAFTFQGVTTTVKKNAKEISAFLKSIGDVQFAGAMKEQADTLNVSLSNMEDSFDKLAKAIGDAGITEVFKNIALDVTEMNTAITDFVKTNEKLIDSSVETGAKFLKFLEIMNPVTNAWRLLNKEQEKSLRFSPTLDPQRLNFPRQEEGAVEGGAPVPTLRSEEDATKARQAVQERFEMLRQSLLSEEDAEKESRLKRLEDLEAFEQINLDKTIDFKALREQIEAEHQEKLTEIERKGLRTRQQIEAASLRQKASAVFGQLAQMTAGVSQHSKELFAINKAAAIANTALNIPESMSDAYKWGNKFGGPALGAAFAATAGAVQAAQIAAIASTSFGGGGGAAPSLAGATAAPPVSDVGGGGGGESRGLDINIGGIGDSGIPAASFREIIAGINEEIENGAQITGITVG